MARSSLNYHETMNRKLIHWISNEMRDRKISGKNMANVIGVSPHNFYARMRGDTRFSWDDIVEIAHFFNKETEFLEIFTSCSES